MCISAAAEHARNSIFSSHQSLDREDYVAGANRVLSCVFLSLTLSRSCKPCCTMSQGLAVSSVMRGPLHTPITAGFSFCNHCPCDPTRSYAPGMWTRHTASCKRYKEEQDRLIADMLKAKQLALELAEMEAITEAEKVKNCRKV